MQLRNHLQKLRQVIQSIESNNDVIRGHNRNANYGNIGSALAYGLTSGSNSKSTRTIGQLGALAGLVYSSKERGRARNVQNDNLYILKSSIDQIFNDSIVSLVKNETDFSCKSEYLSLCLSFASYYDYYLLKYIRQLESKTFLTESNRSLLFHLDKIDLFVCKRKILNFFSRFDSKVSTKMFLDYQLNLRNINIQVLKGENIWVSSTYSILVVSTILLFYLGQQTIGIIGIILISVFYLSNIYFPLFSENRKAQNFKLQFLKEIKKLCNLGEIKF